MKFNTKVYARFAALVSIAMILSMATLQRLGLTTARGPLATLVLTLGVLGGVYILAARDSWLPFLGDAAVPSSLLRLRTPDESGVHVTVTVDPSATHVMYWASTQHMGVFTDPHSAYADYSNSGVVVAAGGKATLSFKCPGRYAVRGMTLAPHVHYRAVLPNGIATRVETVKVDCI